MGLRREGGGWRCRPILWGRLNSKYGTIGVEHLSFEEHFGGLVGELEWEPESGFVESSLEGSIFWSLEAYSPIK